MPYAHTSRAAWKSFLPVSPTLDDMILAYLTAVGPEGATCEEIETAIGRSHQAVSGNLRHLVEKGLVEYTGVDGKTKSGRSAKKWRSTPLVAATSPSIVPSAGIV